MKNKGQFTIGVGIALSIVLASVTAVSGYFSGRAGINDVEADVKVLQSQDINFDKRFDTLEKNLDTRFDNLESLIKAINEVGD